ncbi:MAG: acetoacetyl-CoA reductase [Gammaproteobacteria bacterium]|jgi:acetoacetyl-CoA reductase
MKIDLQNKLALVAEGNNDLGRAICAQLAESGAQIICLVRNDNDASQAQSYFNKAKLKVKIYDADIRDFDACEKVIHQIKNDIGDIDIIINNSDFSFENNFSDMTPGEWTDCMKGNLDGTYNLCRLISESMSQRGFGRIINISSMYGRKGAIGKSAYSASKLGLHGFTMALAQEVARSGVTVNTISPGHIKTVQMESMPTVQANSIIADIPVARFGEAEEVASLVDYLCSQQASFITGTDIAINGGQYIH